jgi:hypothetical protein
MIFQLMSIRISIRDGPMLEQQTKASAGTSGIVQYIYRLSRCHVSMLLGLKPGYVRDVISVVAEFMVSG